MNDNEMASQDNPEKPDQATSKADDTVEPGAKEDAPANEQKASANETSAASSGVDGKPAPAAKKEATKKQRRILILLSIPLAVLIIGTVATWWRPVSLLLLCPILKEMGNTSLAEPLAKRAIELYVKEEGVNSRNTMWAVWNLAEIYRTSKKFSRAEPLYRGLAQYNEKQKGDQTVMPFQALRGYSETLRALGKNSEADKVDARLEYLKKKPSASKNQR